MLRSLLTRLFSRRRLETSADTIKNDIERRQQARQVQPISNACRANALTKSERDHVFSTFEAMAPTVGFHEARQIAVNLAASLAAIEEESDALADGDPKADELGNTPLTMRNTIEIGQHREAALALAIAKQRPLGLALVAHALAESVNGVWYQYSAAPWRGQINPSHTERPADIADQVRACCDPVAFGGDDQHSPPLSWFLAKSVDELTDYICQAAALCFVDPKASNGKSHNSVNEQANASVDALAEVAGINLADYWSPDIDWLKRYGKANLIRELAEIGDLGEEDQAKLSAQTVAQLAGYALPLMDKWLPPEFRR